ncbi:class I SAM-dependent methyltransferase [Endozoicomonas atrinae]|uniref:class I SAM-dependent methyltransferase n=1 Tax=Endozoicomonas atrinae TaxID=1333660 RepID=UPI000825A595|nr:class I SAM-dependent methyltransferase [Endozoicomonas atrinae]
MDDQQLQALALQLSCPSDKEGKALAEEMNDVNAFITERSIEQLAPAAGEYIVEVGSGNGMLSLPIVKALGGSGTYIGLELSADMAREAEANLMNHQSETVTILNSDVMSAAIEPASVDGLIVVNTLYFLDDLDALFRNIKKWLKPGSRAVFGIRSEQCLKALPYTRYGFHIRPLADIKESLLANGFKSVSSSYFDEGVTQLEGLEIKLDSLIIKAIV